MQIQSQLLQVEGHEMTAVSFNNMSEYMRNFSLTKQNEKLEKERNALLKLIRDHYDDTSKFIEGKYFDGNEE